MDDLPDYRYNIDQYLKQQFNLINIKYEFAYFCELIYHDNGYNIDHITGPIITDYYGVSHPELKRVDDVSDIASVAECIASEHLEVTTHYTDDLIVAKRWLNRIDSDIPVVACDFEAHNLAIPQFNNTTMLTLAWSYTKSIVIIFDTDEVRQLVTNWLVATQVKQIWHNALYDLRIVHYQTGKLPTDIEDTQLLAGVYRNHVNPTKRIVGLKSLAGHLYGDWASDKSTFDLYDNELNDQLKSPSKLIYIGSGDISKYNLGLTKYAGVDSCATYFIWDKFNTEPAVPSVETYTTSEPRYNTEQFNQRYYYEFILKPGIKSIIRMLNHGQCIDLDKVESLKQQTESMKTRLTAVIDQTPIVREFQSIVDQERIDKFLAPVHKAMKHPTYSGYKNTVAMRTFVVNYWDHTNLDKVTATDLKSMNTPITQLLNNKQFTHPAIVAASNAYEVAKCLAQNTTANRIDKVANPQNYVDIGFNPFNYSQLTQMWTHLGLVSTEISKKTGEMSFSKDILKDLSKTVTDPVIKQVLVDHLEIASAKMIITTYIPKYIGSTVDGRVFSSIKLLGTISGRVSGSASKLTDENKDRVGINAVTQPSSSSAFSKPVKELFIAAPGKILCGIDYNALNTMLQNEFTYDENKQMIISNSNSPISSGVLGSNA